MKTRLTIFALIYLASISARAQNLIAVQHAGVPKFYTDLPLAITGALAGDTVYIPGGSYPAITISKQLCLIGVGANPDSTKIGGKTIIASLALSTGVDKGSLSGIYTVGGISLGAVINGYTISRCYINSIGGPAPSTSNFLLKENIINYIVTTNADYWNLSNNIFTGMIQGLGLSYIKNNIFLFPGTQLYSANGIIENNIFAYFPGSNSEGGPGYNFFYNNVNAGVNSDGSSSSVNVDHDQGNGNFFDGINITNIFPTYGPSVLNTDGIYEVNFNLPANSKYKKAGTDGTDLGIYGGAYPWKSGSIPSNPHFQSITIGPTTDSSGNLKVQITVAAQNN